MGIKLGTIFFCFGTILGIAQNDSLSSNNFKYYDDKIINSLYFIDTSNSFSFLFESGGENKQLNLLPNRKAQIGVNISYKFIDISYGFSPYFFAENKDNSDSKLFTLSTRLYHKKWMQSIVFINQKGFYIQDDITAYFPRLRTTKIGGTTSYIFNDKFSFKTIVNQKEWQTKSAGSFIPNFSFFYTNFDLNDGSSGQYSDVYLSTLSASYFYNLVIKKQLLISVGISPGFGFNRVDNNLSTVYELTGSLNLGYNIDSFFSLLNLNFTDFTEDSTAKIKLNDSFSTFKFTFGYRFDPPKKAKEIFDRVNRKILSSSL